MSPLKIYPSRAALAHTKSNAASFSRKTAALIGAITLAGAALPAHAAADMSSGVGADQLTHRICQTVVGLRPGESHFEFCVSSLSESLQSVNRALAVGKVRDDCVSQGLAPGGVPLSLCLLKASNAKSASDNPLPTDNLSAPTAETGPLESAGSYFAASPDTKFRREQEACARLGFDPAFGAFAGCVANLQSAFQDLDRPQG